MPPAVIHYVVKIRFILCLSPHNHQNVITVQYVPVSSTNQWAVASRLLVSYKSQIQGKRKV